MLTFKFMGSLIGSSWMPAKLTIMFNLLWLQNWSNLLWALATLQENGADLGNSSSVSAIVAAGAAAVEQLCSLAKPQELSNTLWALATLGWHRDDSTLTKLVSAMVQRISSAKPQDLSNTLWALATLGWHRDDNTLTKLVTAMVQRISSAKPQDLSNTVGTGHPWLAP